MTAAIALGAALGSGLLLVLSGLVPARTPLTVALARLHRPQPPEQSNGDIPLLVRLVGRPLARTSLAAATTRRLQHDLRVVGRTADDLVTQLTICALVGLLWAPATVALAHLGGVHVDPLVPLWCSVSLAAAGTTTPVMALRARAAERRRAFRHALGCYLDLVAVRLAGGAGVETALTASAHSGDGWAFTELRQALDQARRRGEPPWAGLDQLGRDLAVSELVELAASVTLAGDEGARVRASITTKARSIRTRGLTDAERDAQAASERMSLPIVLLMFGFVIFLGYPAVTQVLTGL